MATTWVYIQMINFKQTVKAVSVTKGEFGYVKIVAADGKVYETHLSNVVIMSDTAESPDKSNA